MPSKKSQPDSTQVAQPRLRILAGPNGSGKSTIKDELNPEWLGIFVNADEIERSLRETGGLLDLANFGVNGEPPEVLNRIEQHIRSSTFAGKLGLHALLGKMAIDDQLCIRVPKPYNSYLASVLADTVRQQLLDQGDTFTFETVMSSHDKVDFMKKAKERGYRVYLYFVATDDADINVDRVGRRVSQGGHPVPAIKIRERYVKSIRLMTEACGIAHRAYVFDNSGSRHKLLVQVTDGNKMETKAATLPRWFVNTKLWQSFN